MTPLEIKTEMAKHRWWHRIELADGIVTPGECAHGTSEAELSERWGLPEFLEGQSVLDVGCWDGLFSVACLRRGARRVTGLDVVARPTFELVQRARGILFKSAFHRVDAQQKFHYRADTVLCFGVIYHVENPLAVLANCVEAAWDRVIVETALAAQVRPAADGVAWVQERGHDFDPSNVWYPTEGAVLDALRVFGCRVARVHHRLPVGMRATFVGTK